MTIAENEVELIEESHVQDAHDRQHVDPKATGNWTAEIVVSETQDPSPTSIDLVNAVGTADDDHLVPR